MYKPDHLNVEDTLDEYIHFTLPIPTTFTFDYKDYLEHYSHMGGYSQESVLYSILVYWRNKYPNMNLAFENIDLPIWDMKDVLKAESVGHFVGVDCIVNRVGQTSPDIHRASVICSKCFNRYSYIVENETLQLPAGMSCNDCGSTKFQLIPEDCSYVDTQRAVVQELQEKCEHGKQPKSIHCVIRGNLTDIVTAGERVRLYGIVRIRYDSGINAKVYLDVLSIVHTQVEDVVVTDDDIVEIKRLANNPNIYEMLANSLSPLVYGYDVIKKAIVFQVFGGTNLQLGDGISIRGNSHVLLCGDPSVAKSQLIRAVSNLIPRSVYTSGKSSSGVGLTASVLRDDDGKFYLQAGAIVLADGGLLVCDELDKLTTDDRSTLHEALESQTISINKAGISAQLYCRCSMLAAANPMLSSFDENIPLEQQVDLPASLMTRFDLIFLITDKPDEYTDSMVARHIIRTRRNAEQLVSGINPVDKTGIEKPIPTELFRKYIQYAKGVVPIICDDVIDLLVSEYVRLRNDGQIERRIAPRQLEALLRLSEASARIRLSEVITKDDVDRALSLYNSSVSSINVNSHSEWKRSDNIYLSVIPAQGILLQDYVDEITRRTLFADEEVISNELYKLVDTHKVILKQLGSNTFVMRAD